MLLLKTLKADWFKLGTALLIFKTVLLLIHTSTGIFDNSLIVAPSKTQLPTHRKEVSAKIKRHSRQHCNMLNFHAEMWHVEELINKSSGLRLQTGEGSKAE